MKTSHILLVAALSTLAFTARAQSSFYVGASGGLTDFGTDASEEAIFRGRPHTVSSGSTDFGWKLVAGVQFTPNWGLEYNYIDFGKKSLTGTVEVVAVTPGTPPVFGTATIPYSAKISSTAGALGVTYRHTLNDQFALIGKIGAYDQDSKSTGTLFPTRLSLGGTHLFAEVGASYQVNPRFAWVADAGFYFGGDKNLLISTGPRFAF